MGRQFLPYSGEMACSAVRDRARSAGAVARVAGVEGNHRRAPAEAADHRNAAFKCVIGELMLAFRPPRARFLEFRACPFDRRPTRVRPRGEHLSGRCSRVALTREP